MQAIQNVADCGIQAFEFWGWWDRDLDAIIQARDLHQLTVSACCTHFISLVDPDRRDDYLAGLEASIAAAQRLDCQTLISQVGDFRPGIDRESQFRALVDGLQQAAPMLEAAGITLVIEPLNEWVDHPGYFLTRSDEAFAAIDQVGSDRVKVVFDIYHQQISEGNVIENITRNIAKIGHFHAAGNPGRHELTCGELHYPSIFAAIAESGFEGFVGLEYWPKDDPAAGLRQVVSWF
ncbi:Hydroxypyruvate isomerase [Rosistilla carotiformis]|uniref:Hydroxypyruvate isomerase n=1 Tax=Rosistilla carotiformis TaxID=2528017 RepID=A0A518JZG7_9BACT|nr:Hydroxypyruvate isomerase [Rosistilla carotiformis]